jgi:hypothetical protein
MRTSPNLVAWSPKSSSNEDALTTKFWVLQKRATHEADTLTSKYDPLRQYLVQMGTEPTQMAFSDIEKVIGLPFHCRCPLEEAIPGGSTGRRTSTVRTLRPGSTRVDRSQASIEQVKS